MYVLNITDHQCGFKYLCGLLQNHAKYTFSVSRIGETISLPAPTCLGAFEVCVGNPGFGGANVNG